MNKVSNQEVNSPTQSLDEADENKSFAGKKYSNFMNITGRCSLELAPPSLINSHHVRFLPQTTTPKILLHQPNASLLFRSSVPLHFLFSFLFFSKVENLSLFFLLVLILFSPFFSPDNLCAAVAKLSRLST